MPFFLASLVLASASDSASDENHDAQVKMNVVCDYANFNPLITVSWAGTVRKSSEPFSICLEMPKDDEPDKIFLIRRFPIEFKQSQLVFPPKEWEQRCYDEVSIAMYRGKTLITALDGVILADICPKHELDVDDDEEENEGSKKWLKYNTY